MVMSHYRARRVHLKQNARRVYYTPLFAFIYIQHTREGIDYVSSKDKKKNNNNKNYCLWGLRDYISRTPDAHLIRDDFFFWHFEF